MNYEVHISVLAFEVFLQRSQNIYPRPSYNRPQNIYKLSERTNLRTNGCFNFLQHFLAPVCRQIETDLRLHIHQHLQVGDRNPFRVSFGP